MLATHLDLQQRGYCGLNVLLVADLAGPLDPAALRSAATALVRACPALGATIRHVGLRGRPAWTIAPDADPSAAIEVTHAAGSGDDADAPILDALNDCVDPHSGSQIRIVHVALDTARHRLAIRWPHHLFDLAGAHRLLHNLHRIMTGGSPIGQGHADSPIETAEPYTLGPIRRFVRTWQGRWRHARLCRARQPRIVPKPDDPSKRADLTWTHLDAGQRDRLQTLARQRLDAGPMLYSRYVLAGIARTYLDICQRKGRPREKYLFSHVQAWPGAEERLAPLGNYLTVPWFEFVPADLADWAATDRAIRRQLAMHDRGGAEADWAAAHAGARWPFSVVRAVAAHQLPSAAAGATTYRFGDAPTHLGEARIVRLAAAGTMAAHPGWIVAHTTFADELTFCITSFRDYLNAAAAREFLDELATRLLT